MKKFYLFILILILFILQYSVLGVFLQSTRIPNLFVALAASLAIIFGFEKSIGWTVLAGFLMDIGAPWPVGSGILILVLILWLVDRLKVVAELRSRRYFFISLFALIVFVSAFAFDLLLKFELGAERYILENAPAFSGPVANLDYFFKLAYSVILGMGIYHFCRKARSRSHSLPAVRRTG